jgi:hypothetical protein
MKRSHVILGRRQKIWLYGLTSLLWLSGTLWLLLPDGHPIRPLWMRMHGAAAMGFLMAFGALLLQHVPRGWKEGDQRPSGGPLVAVCGLMILTGWGLYYLADETLRHWTALLHWIPGLLFPALLLLHVRLGKNRTL